MGRLNGHSSEGLKKTMYYVDGNTVRKAEEVLRPKRPEHHDTYIDRRTKSNRQREHMLDGRAVVYMSLSLVLVALAASFYLYMRSTVSGEREKIASLEDEYIELQSSNDSIQKELDTSVDLNKIKKKAINKLGMQYPKKNQIVYYSVESDDYMEQYENIP